MNHQGKLNNKSIINKHCYIAILFLITLLSLPQTVLSQQEERLAVVSEYEGDVKVEHESIKKTVKKIGNRIRNSAVYEEDSVMTMHNSTAGLVFNDNTSLEIDEDTSLTVCSRHMSADECSEGGFIKQVSGKQSGIVRNINIKAGKFLANITPSKSVLTEFETPNGVASVRGTKFAFAYISGVTSIDLTQGLIDFASAGNEVSFSIEPGVAVDISTPESGRASVHVNRGQLDVRVNSGSINVESGETAGVQVDEGTGEITISSEEGVVELETGTGTVSIEEGGALEATVDAETGEVEVTGVEGEVTITNDDGTIIEVEAGTSLGTQGPAETEFSAKIMNMKGGKKDMLGKGPDSNGPMGPDGGSGDDTYIDNFMTGTISDNQGNVYSFKDFQFSSDNAKNPYKDNVLKNYDDGAAGAHPGTPTTWTQNVANSWTKKNAYTDTAFGAFSAPGSNSETTIGDVQFTENFGSDANFAVVHTGYSTNENNGFLKIKLDFNTPGTLQAIFDYNFITSELGGGTAPDAFEVSAISGLTTRQLTYESAWESKSSLTATSGLPYDTLDTRNDVNGDRTGLGGTTGWQTFERQIVVPSGITTLVFDVSDAFDSKIDSAVLLDNIATYFTAAPVAQTQVLADWTATNTWTPRQNAYTSDNFGSYYAPSIATQNDTSTAKFFENFNQGVSTDEFAVLHTYDTATNGYMKVTINFATPGNLQTIFNYNFITADTQASEMFVLKLVKSGTSHEVFRVTATDDTLTEVSGLPDAPITDAVGKATDWTVYDRTHTIPSGDITFFFDVKEFLAGNTLKDSAVLLDNIAMYFTANADLDTPQINPQDWVPSSWSAIETWDRRQNAYTTKAFGPITVPDAGSSKSHAVFAESFGSNDAGDNNFAVIHTGLGNNGSKGYLDWDFTVPAGGESRQISFDYNFIATHINSAQIKSSQLNDYFKVELLNSAGNSIAELATGSVYSSFVNNKTLNVDYFYKSGLPLDTLDTYAGSGNGYETGWLSFATAAGGIELASGLTTLRFSVFDVDASGNDVDDAGFNTGHALYDSALLLDNVIDPPVEASSTDYLLTFARMLRGEIDVHDADLEADAVASEEHQAFVAMVNEVISDMENISIDEFIEGKDVLLDRLWVAREIVADHEETAEFVQQTAVAHNLLEAAVITNQGIGSHNITAIQDSLNQAKSFLVAHINDFGEVDALANIKTNIDSVLVNIDNMNNNVYTTATLVAIRDGIKQAFSDTIDHMTGTNSLCGSAAHPECEQHAL